MAESSNSTENEKCLNSDLLEKDFYDTTKRSVKIRRRVQKKNFQCEVCKKTFSRNHLTDHVRTHTGEKPYTCEICNKSFIQISNLKTHLFRHTGEKPFSCHFCDKRFTFKQNFLQHFRLHTGENPYECEICGKKFRIRQVMKNHMRLHSGVKPFTCHFCVKEFTYKKNFLQHLRIHTGEKPFECEICKKKFRTAQMMKNHMRLHPEMKPFTCKFCEQNKCCECSESFRYEKDYQKHIRIHKLLKSFICYQCDKEFTKASDLILHLRSCMGKMSDDCEERNVQDDCEEKNVQDDCEEKNVQDDCEERNVQDDCEERNVQKPNHQLSSRFVCYQCEKRFTEASDLIIHLRICISKKPYACSTCEREFDYKEVFRKHRCETQNSIKSLQLKDNIYEKHFSAEKNLIEDNEESSDTKKSETNPNCNLMLKQVSDMVKLDSTAENVIQKVHFPCKVCQEVFTQECLLNEHTFTHATVKQSDLMQYELSFDCELLKEELSDEGAV